MWKIIDDYLNAVALALSIHRSELTFVSHFNGVQTVMSADEIYNGGFPLTSYSVMRAGSERAVTWFSLTPMPGCCGACISHGAGVNEGYRRLGIGKLTNALRVGLAREKGYTVLICTDIIANESQRKILAANGWEDVYKFRNRRTNNDLALSVVHLWPEPTESTVVAPEQPRA